MKFDLNGVKMTIFFKKDCKIAQRLIADEFSD